MRASVRRPEEPRYSAGGDRRKVRCTVGTRGRERYLVSWGTEDPTIRSRVLCFHCAGGNALSWASFAESICSDGVAVCAYQLPGRMSLLNEPALESMSEVIEHIIETCVALRLLDAPRLIFVGHSYGGLVAYLVAQACMQRGLATIDHVCILGTATPEIITARVTAGAKSVQSDTELLSFLLGLGGIPEQLRRSSSFMKMFIATTRSDYRAIESFRHQPTDAQLTCPLTVMGGDADPAAEPAVIQQWRAYTSSTFNAHIFEGGHFFHKDPQHEHPVADIVKRIVTPEPQPTSL